MRVEPKLHEIVKGERGMLRGIEVCLEKQCLVSAVSLLFAAIDALAALTRPAGHADTDGGIFEAWVQRYLLPDSSLKCGSADLYAARCGVLHTYGVDSRRARHGGARRLVYEWRQGPAADAAAPLPPNAMVVEVEALHSAFRNAIDRFLEAASTDPEVSGLVQDHLASLLCYTPWPRLSVHVAA